MKKAAALLLALLLMLPALGALAESQKFSDIYTDAFDTVISFIAYMDDSDTFSKTSSFVHSEYQRLHKLFDVYNEYDGVVSLCTLNRTAAEGPVEVDPTLFDCLAFCKKEYQDGVGNGQTNVAMGSVLSIWHEYREYGIDHPEEASLPEMSALEAANEHVSMDDLVLDETNHTVYFADPELKLDLGAVAKGYSTELIAKELEDMGCPSFIISAGGNVRVGEAPRDGRSAWGVGIQDPDGAVLNTSAIVDALYLTNLSVVTSGDYQRYYEVDGKRYCHLIDPDTLMPGDYFRSVSIITADSGYADYLSTAAYLMDYDKSRAFIDSLDGVEAIWIMPDGTKRYTEGAKQWSSSYGASNKKK